MPTRRLFFNPDTVRLLDETRRHFGRDFTGFLPTHEARRSDVVDCALLYARVRGLTPDGSSTGSERVKVRLRQGFLNQPTPQVVSLVGQALRYYCDRPPDGAVSRLRGRAVIGVSMSDDLIDSIAVGAWAAKRPIEDYAVEVVDRAMARSIEQVPRSSSPWRDRRTWNIRADERLKTQLVKVCSGDGSYADWWIERNATEEIARRRA